jgi:hypothetical protein
MHHLWLWVLHVSGSDNVSGKWYGFWSGFGGDLGIIGALAAVPWMQYKRHNCQVKGCWRIGRHEFTDPDEHVTRLLCWRHHPSVRRRQLTRERLHLYVGKRPGPG